ncbi:MAG: endonuclease V [Candidatus Aminicenantes bacterium]|nr:endonuclease V [Candidatus Aminicenantes bacterium]
MFDFKKAAETQARLSTRLKLSWDSRNIQYVGGADSSYDETKKKIGVVVVVYKVPELILVEISREIQDVSIPYVPGFLNYREGPAFLRAFRKLSHVPDVTLIDGNGIAHPRRMGLASYVGVILDISTIGCAKSPFYPYTDPGEERGSHTPFTDTKGEQVGFCLRTRSGTNPVFVSPGNRTDFTISRQVVLGMSVYRIPEPLRRADHLAGKIF